MQRRTTYIILVAIGVLLIGGGLYVAVFNWDSIMKLFFPAEVAVEQPVTGNANNLPGGSGDKPVQPDNGGDVKKISADLSDPGSTGQATGPVPDREAGQAEYIVMAESFAERFGSYSNQSNFANIVDLKLFMSANMRKWADNYIATHKQSNDYQVYYGVTTKVIGHEVESWDDESGNGAVLVHTRRREISGSEEARSFSQDASVKLIKEGDSWKVDSVLWLD